MHPSEAAPRNLARVGRAAAAVDTKPIFISYRRDDTSGYAGRLQDDLAELFGDDLVFRDVVKIEPGRDFLEVIGDALQSCAAMIVVIGREWVGSVDETGRRRLDNPADVLRLEVTAALERKTLVIPVLVEKAEMPRPQELPEALRPLTRRQAIELTDASWDHDVGRLAAAITAATGTPTRPRRGVRSRRTLPRRPLIAVAAVVALLVVAQAVRLLAADGGGPEPMTGRLNIAVAEFAQLDTHGDLVKSSTSTRLAKSFDRLLDQELKAVDGGREVQHRLIGRLNDADADRRAAAAERAGGSIAADIVVYGVLQSDTSGSVLMPELYITDRLLFDAGEVVGYHQLGSPIRSPGDAQRLAVQNQLLDQLAARIQVLAEATVALRYYSVEDYATAFSHLAVAEQRPGWAPEDGKEVLYLLLGNVAGKLGRLAEAKAYYDRALDLRPDYSRASLGKAEVIYHGARGDCEQGHIDAAGLRHSLDLYGEARRGRLPAGAEVPAKAAFGEGRVLMCLSQALDADRWSEAEERFLQVVRAYGAGDERVRELAAEAHANLGFVYRPWGPDEPGARDKYLRAAGEYTKAITLYQQAGKNQARQATFYSELGYVLTQAQDRPAAAAAYANAIRLAPDPQTADRYRLAQRDGGAGRPS